MLSLLAAATWRDAFPVIRFVMLILMLIIGVGLVVVIMFSPSSQSGMGALSGQRDTFYAKDKSKSLETVMKRLTIGLGITEGVLAILFFVTFAFSQFGV